MFSLKTASCCVFVICLVPFTLLLWNTITGNLGANPIQTLHFSLGDWALRFLCLTLTLTPAKLLLGWNWITRYRRMLGLYCFFYASLHLLVYLVLDLSFSWEQFSDEIPKSPYILVGLFTYFLLTILAVTSTKKMQKRLGKSWKKLHRLVFLAAFSALVHFFWLVKLDYTEPVVYASIVILLLVPRIFFALRKTTFLQQRT